MAQNLKLNKVAALPGSLEPNAIYFRKGGADTYSDLIVADSAGNGVEVISNARINSLITAATNTEIELVADIAARDALTLTQNSLVLVTDASADATVATGAAMYFWDNAGASFVKVTEFESMDVVLDWNALVNGPTSTAAQIDASVAESAANKTKLDTITDVGSGQIITAAERTQITTNASGVTTNAAAIATNGTNIGTNATAITALQADSHTHANKTELDKIGEDANGQLLYGGVTVNTWETVGWMVLLAFNFIGYV